MTTFPFNFMDRILFIISCRKYIIGVWIRLVKSVCRKERSHGSSSDRWAIFGRKYDKKRLVMYVNAPFENHSERYGMYVFIRKLDFVSQEATETFSTLDYGGNNSTSFFAHDSRSTWANSSSPSGVRSNLTFRVAQSRRLLVIQLNCVNSVILYLYYLLRYVWFFFFFCTEETLCNIL